MFLLGCASTQTPGQQITNDVRTTVQQFDEAVRNHRADAVFALMSDTWKLQFTKETFRDFFEKNYPLFLEYSEALMNDKSLFKIQAVYAHDPCGAFVSWQLSEDGEWKLAGIPKSENHMKGADLEEERLTRVRNRLLTEIFFQSLSTYAKLHPELTSDHLRQIKRFLYSREFTTDSIQVVENEAFLTIPKTAIIRMSCSQEGWSVVQCYSIR